MIQTVAMLFAVTIAPASDWLPLNSPSPALVRGFDAASVERHGDEVTFNAVFATRDVDNRTHRLTSERVVVPVRLNCRSWRITIGAGPVESGDGSVISPGVEAQPTHDADPDQWRQACDMSAIGKGASTVQAFLDHQWPAEIGHGRGW